MSQNEYNLNATSPNQHERVCYTHKTGKTSIGWIHTAQRMS